MQPVNVLPTFVSQEADLNTKESLDSSGESSKDSNFSRMVEEHVAGDKDTQVKAESSAATNGNVTAINGKNATNTDNKRQENDSSSRVTSNKSNPDSKESSDSIDNQKVLVQENSKDKSIETEALTESEQFISLLYNSDQTLTSSKEKPMQAILTDNQKISIVNKPDVSVVNEDNLIGEEDSVEDNVSVEHKLKSFSKDEVIARASLKRNALIQPSTDLALKDYQLSLQSPQAPLQGASITSEQLMNAQLSNAELKNNKITDLAVGVAQVNKSQLTEKVNSDVSNPLLDLIAKESVVKSALNIGDNKNPPLVQKSSEVQAQLLSEKVLEQESEATPEQLSELSAEEIKAAVLAASISGDSSKADKVKPVIADTANGPVNKVDEDKQKIDKNLQATVAGEKITQEQPIEAQIKHPGVTNNQVLSSQALQQNQAQQKIEPNIDNKVIEDAGEEYIDPVFLAEDKPVEQALKTTSKVTDPMTVRTSSDVQAQTVQSTQMKQSNDAYMEHQSSEALNHTVASDTAQIQKNNVQLQQETISIFKKDFADAVKDKVMIMINQKIQQFDITLDPPEFGNMQVRVNLQGEQAAVNFVVQNQQAKEALEQNMHKLKEMLAEQGVDVGGANVEQQNQQSDNDEKSSDLNNENKGPLSSQNKDEHNVEHILSANLFDSPATGVDYYA